MSIKDFFEKGHSLKHIRNKTKDDLREDVESSRYINAYSKRRRRFRPDVDFTTASNFARFGLAELYYEDSIKRIYQTYPYDGSQAEKIEWENESSYLDLFIFENEYPRTNGFVSFNSGSSSHSATVSNSILSSSAPEYIFIKGGPNADPDGDYKSDFGAGPSKDGISKANIYHTASQRTNNLEFDPGKGITVEFWLKKEGWVSTGADRKEYLFNSAVSGSTAATYSNFEIYSKGSRDGNIYVQVDSGSTSIAITHDTGLANIADSEWRHYAVTFETLGSKSVSNLYVDGIHKSKQTSSDTVNAFDGAMVGALGARAHFVSSSATGKYADVGWGNVLSSSFDEFRYWKTVRNSQQIGRFYLDQVGGGTNTDNDKHDEVTNYVDLGVYYKFNEGITEVSATDSTVLDYSGRISNGNFVNYNTSRSRSTGSAIVLSNAAQKEFQDPIVYSYHPSVSSLYESKRATGSMHDFENISSIYKSLPSWIVEEDEKKSKHLKYLTQVMASFFDDFFLQIEKLPRLKDINYPYDDDYEKPLPFADRLLTSKGYDAPELFEQASILAQYLERDEKLLFEKKLYEVKRIIYQNIYNNLSFIQKSKGTFTSLRNFLRCFGVDEELVKLNVYSRDDVYELKDNHVHTSIRKRYIDFDDLETRLTASNSPASAYSATAYQYYDSDDSNSLSYIPGVSATFASGAACTLEAEVVFPKRSLGENDRSPTISSIFGIHAVPASNTSLAFATASDGDTVNFNIVATKPDNDTRNVKFGLRTSGSSPVFSDLTNSDAFLGVYDNEKWNLAFRLRPTKNPLANLVSGSLEVYQTGSASEDSAYTYELYGTNFLSNIQRNEFILSGTISRQNAEKFFTSNKRIFVGAARNNFVGTVDTFSDVKVSSVKYWLDYLSDETIRAHAKNANTYGTLHPYKNSNFSVSHANLFNVFIPQIETLALNWSLDNVTGSDSSGQFAINDFSSGSATDRTASRYGWVSDVTKYSYPGRGDLFTSTSNTKFSEQAIDIDFISTAKQKLPEVVNSDDMIKILNKQDELVFTRDTTFVQTYLSVEKSMYQVISEEMLRYFATIVDFNNLIGDPVNRYRPVYKRMGKLRDLFFEKVENEPDLDKFIEYFKWIDDAVTLMITQLIPASAASSGLLRNMVESHILERNKYWTKFPTLEAEAPPLVSSLKGVNELKYNWKFGHAPLSSAGHLIQSENCLWWKDRAERTSIPLSRNQTGSAHDSVNSDRDSLLKTIITEVTGTEPTLKTSAGTKYASSYYPIRKFNKPVAIEQQRMLKLKGGSNPDSQQRHDIYKNIIKWGSDDDFVYLDIDNEIKQVDCDDQEIPAELDKKEFRFNAFTMMASETVTSSTGITESDLQYTDAKSSLILPFNVYTASMEPGASGSYSTKYSTQFKIDFTNMHDDKYGLDAEVPMQGPFTEQHVGGMQHRHVELNRFDSVTNNIKGSTNSLDGAWTRPEGWHLQQFLDSSADENIIYEQFSGATTTATTDVSILDLPVGSYSSDPSAYEYWKNGTTADNTWTFLRGTTPSAGTGPSGTDWYYAYCEVLPTKVGQTFDLITPLVDALGPDGDSRIRLIFNYHMYGVHIGKLEVQASTDSNFSSGNVETIAVISGQKQTTATAAWGQIQIDSAGTSTVSGPAAGEVSGTKTLANFINKRFYIRFLYTAGVGHLGDCAIDFVKIFKTTGASGTGFTADSFRLLDPSHDDHHRPRAVYTRQEYAKRPVNIRNILMTGSSPTKAGNYLDRYEFLNVVGSEANNPWFVKNHASITRTSSFGPLTPGTASSMVSILDKRSPQTDAPQNTGLYYSPFTNYGNTLEDRAYLSGTVRNRTRFINRFSSPGDFRTISRGYLDVENETFSAYNAMPFRNRFIRQVHSSQLQAHQGRHGVSKHISDNARVLQSEEEGAIRTEDYAISGQAANHKYHRNNLERHSLTKNTAADSFVTGTSYAAGINDRVVLTQYYQGNKRSSHVFGDASSDDAFSISAWVKMEDATSFPIIGRNEVGTDANYIEWKLTTGADDKLYFYTYDNVATVYERAYSAALTSYQDQWIHIVATADAEEESKSMKLYLNGVELATTRDDNGSYTAMHDTSAKIYIGRDDVGSEGASDFRYATGSIDEVALWSAELSAAEVLEMYHAGATENIRPGVMDLTKHSKAANLVSWWRFGDKTRGEGLYSGNDKVGGNLLTVHDVIQGIVGNLTGKPDGGVPQIVRGAPYGWGDQVVTKSNNNNGFVSHMIPRSDKQMSWITASLI